MVTVHQIRWINENMDIEERLGELGITVPPNGKIFCPFHYNVNTPSAKVYDGRLYCYAEKKHYTVFDVMKLVGYSDDDIRNMVPRDHWFTGEEVRSEPVKIPILGKEERDVYVGRVFDYLSVLEYAWENPGLHRCLHL